MMNFNDDNKLLKELVGGGEKALKFLYQNYYRRLHAYANKFTDDSIAAQDIVQECFIRLWEKRSELHAVSIRSLLFTMVRNSSLNHLKLRDSIDRGLSEYFDKTQNESALYYANFLNKGDEDILYNELETRIYNIIEELPPRCKEVFIMSRIDELKNREIAEKLNISTTAVEKHISKAVLHISARMSREGYSVKRKYQ